MGNNTNGLQQPKRAKQPNIDSQGILAPHAHARCTAEQASWPKTCATVSRKPAESGTNRDISLARARDSSRCSENPGTARTMSCDRQRNRSDIHRRYRRATARPQDGRLARVTRDLTCGVCSADGPVIAGPAARSCAGCTRYLTFTYTGSPVSRQ